MKALYWTSVDVPKQHGLLLFVTIDSSATRYCAESIVFVEGPWSLDRLSEVSRWRGGYPDLESIECMN